MLNKDLDSVEGVIDVHLLASMPSRPARDASVLANTLISTPLELDDAPLQKLQRL
jgi:hypothetical protein